MNSSELRVGNYCFVNNKEYHPRLKGKIMTVCGLDSVRGTVSLNSIVYTDNIVMPLVSQFEKYISPIPLTEQWLLDFGFDKSYASFDKNKLSVYLPDTYNKYGRMYYDSGRIGDSPKSIHQLQNLYFALTGKELIYNAL